MPARPKAAKPARTPKQQSRPLPPFQLAALAALVSDAEQTEDLGRAVVAARQTLIRALEPQSYPLEIVEQFIAREAEHGPWRELHSAIERLERPEDSPLNATSGDLFNIYVIPAVAIGRALAYVYLHDGGTVPAGAGKE